MKKLLLLLLLVTALTASAQDWAKAKLDKSPRHQEWITVTNGTRAVECFVVYPEIAFNSGFSSSQYFSRIFKNLIGITPSQYRQRRGNLAVYDRRFLQVLTELKASRNGFKMAKGHD